MPIVIDFEKDPFYRKGFRVGKKEGLKLGIQQGIQQGSELEAKRILKEILSEKFGFLSQRLATKIDALGNLNEIERLIKLALRIQKIEECEQALGKKD